MMRGVLACATVMLGIVFLAGPGTSQEKKPKGQLPQHWKKLDLSKEQVLKIYAVQGTYRGKIKGLRDQISSLEKQEKTELLKVLSEEQKDKLRQILLGETSPTKEKKDKAKEK
jgi:hypothetical protein